jgi:hypothetical protein
MNSDFEKLPLFKTGYPKRKNTAIKRNKMRFGVYVCFLTF